MADLLISVMNGTLRTIKSVFSEAISILNGEIVISSSASNLKINAQLFATSFNSLVSKMWGKTLLPLQQSLINSDSTWKIAEVNPLPRSQLACCPITSDKNRHWRNSLMKESCTEGILTRNRNRRQPLGILLKSSFEAKTWVLPRLSVKSCNSWSN